MCCGSSPSSEKVEDRQILAEKIKVYAHQERDAQITAFALGILALFLFALSFFLIGVGTLPPTLVMGLGLFPYLGGVLLSYIAIGIVCSTLIFGVIAGVRSYQKEHAQGEWQRSPDK